MEIYIKIFEVIFPVFFVIGVGYYIGIKNPNEDILYGSFSDGSARKVQSIKYSDHIGILYSYNSQLLINEWINSITKNKFEIIIF